MGKGKHAQSTKLSRQPVSRLAIAHKNLSAKSGMPPGSLVHVGTKTTEKVRISVFSYDENELHVQEETTIQDLPVVTKRAGTTWIQVVGLHQVEIIGAIGRHFGLHPLLLEDILNTTHRPKVEDMGDYLFIIARMLHQNDQTGEIGSEQMSLVLGRNFLLTFQESPRGHFNGVRDRIKAGKGLIRKRGSDYLAYCLVDTVVDKYFLFMERLAERIELLEDELVTTPPRDTMQVLHKLKTDMMYVRRSIWPLREVVSRLVSGETSLIKEPTLPYLRDVYDHTIHVIDTMETYRDVVSGMLDIYLSSISNRLNEIMKVLTIIATMFIPLTFLTGWYGMNFKLMPELEWRWGYPMVMGIALAAVTAMLIAFRRKGWI